MLHLASAPLNDPSPRPSQILAYFYECIQRYHNLWKRDQFAHFPVPIRLPRNLILKNPNAISVNNRWFRLLRDTRRSRITLDRLLRCYRSSCESSEDTWRHSTCNILLRSFFNFTCTVRRNRILGSTVTCRLGNDISYHIEGGLRNVICHIL